jgi:hypothetical protein
VTDTNEGLFDSPVVDGKRHLTPEWLYALAEIETLASLKDSYAKVANADVGRLVEALEDAEQSLRTIVARGVPNSLISSDIPFSEAVAWDGGVPHGLGTSVYFTMARYISNGDLLMHPVPLDAEYGSITRKDDLMWAYDYTFPGRSVQSWFTLSMTPEGITE